MKIIKNKHKSICEVCAKPITLKEYPYKVQDLNNNYHLICFYKWLKKRVDKLEVSLDALRRFRTQMNKYKTHLMLESLEQKI